VDDTAPEGITPEWMAAVHEAGHAVVAASLGIPCSDALVIGPTDDPDYWVGVFHGEAASQTTYATVVVAHAGWTAERRAFGEHPNLASAKAADLTSALEAWRRLDGRTSPGPENLRAMAEAQRRVEALADHIEILAEPLAREHRLDASHVNELLASVPVTAVTSAP